jgi:hypothetical protein
MTPSRMPRPGSGPQAEAAWLARRLRVMGPRAGGPGPASPGSVNLARPGKRDFESHRPPGHWRHSGCGSLRRPGLRGRASPGPARARAARAPPDILEYHDLRWHPSRGSARGPGPSTVTAVSAAEATATEPDQAEWHRRCPGRRALACQCHSDASARIITAQPGLAVTVIMISGRGRAAAAAAAAAARARRPVSQGPHVTRAAAGRHRPGR